MVVDLNTAPEVSRAVVPLEVPLGFSLNFISGRGLLTARDRQVGPLAVKLLELQIPRISFPFDVTGGAERFKSRRCILRHLVLGLDADTLSSVLARANLGAAGFVELKAALREGYVELAGRFRLGEQQADFTMRAALLVRSPTEIGVVFYDTRIYGWLPVPAAMLPVFLRRALALPFVSGDRAGLWEVRPIEQFLLALLPPAGWKLPDARQVAINVAEVARGRVLVAVGPQDDPDQKQIYEREAPPDAVRALDGITTFTGAEQALASGNVQRAYEILREVVDDDRGGSWARDRLLQIGAADPELALETRQLAEETLERHANAPQALLALAAIATRERSWGEAATRFAALGELARAAKDRFDAIAAELAAAEAARPIDPAGSLIAYERVAARARDSITAHQALFELSRLQGDWQRAAQAGERLVKLETDPERLAEVHRELGQLYRSHLRDLKRARVQFERALKVKPDDPIALEGLAETYAARGEPARAASYLARLAEQAEEGGDRARIVALNLRLGEIWERWLGDADSAAARYYRVLDVDPRNRTARLRLAELAEARGELARARELYEDLLQVEEERGDPAAIPDLVGAYTRLARVTLSTSGSSAEAVACLERAVELDPSNRMAREDLARLLRERGAWSELIALLEQAADLGGSPEEARRARIEAARLELEARRDPRAAQALLQRVLAEAPDDQDALDLLLPLLEAEHNVAALLERLTRAAESTPEPARRGALLFAMAQAQRANNDEPQRRRRTLEAVLAADPFHQQAAAALVGLLKDAGDSTALVGALDALAIASRAGLPRADALLAKAKLLWREFGRARQAESALREAVRADPTHERAWTTLASLLEEEGNHETARKALLAALRVVRQQGSDVPALHDRLAALARATGNIEHEAGHLADGLRAGLRGEERLARLVELYTTLGRQAEAARLLEELASAASGPQGGAEMLLAAAALHEQLGSGERAVAIYRHLMRRADEIGVQATTALEALAVSMHDFGIVAQALARQLQIVAPEAHPAVLERLIRAQLACGEDDAAEQSALQLIEHEPLSATATRALALRTEGRGDLDQALAYWQRFLFDAPREGQSREERRQAFDHLSAVALELAPDVLARVRRAFVGEFPEAPADSLATPLGQRLANEQKWDELLALRRKQLSAAKGSPSVELLREVAELLHRRLGRSAEAVPHYQEIIAHHATDTSSRAAIIEILAAQGRYGDLAGHLFALSQMAQSPEEAIAYGLQSAEVYADKLADVASAGQVLSTLRPVAEGGSGNAQLAQALRRFGLVGDLCQVLEAWLGADADAEDGRFVELVGLLADRLGDAARAAAWCERMIEAFPGSDLVRRTFVDLLLRFPQAGDAAKVLGDWAEAREGEARARVYAELAQYLRSAGRDGQALDALHAAAAAQPSSVGILEQLIERHTARGDWPQAIAWLKQLATVTEPGPSRDVRLRRLLEMATDYVDDPGTVLFALKLFERRTDDETRLLAQLLVESGDAEGLATLDEHLVEEFDLDTLLGAARALAAGA
ncbi:MAG: tetratricopeptide repeat protein, partial [Myxococcota bacterium]